MTDYKIRPITEANCEDIWEVYNTNPDYFLTEKGRAAVKSDILEVFSRLPDGYNTTKQCFVSLHQNGQLIAIFELLPHLNEEGTLCLSEIIVHGGLHGQSFGTDIVQGVVQAVTLADFREIQLGTTKSNAKVVSFWKRQGFVECSYDEDGVYFTRNLN